MARAAQTARKRARDEPIPPPPAARRSARLQGVATAPIVDNNTRVNKSQPKPKAKVKPPRFECSTCDRSLAASSFPKRLPTQECKHEGSTCKVCLKAWITAQLESTTYDKLSCPECPEIMQNASIKTNATKETYQKFDELERRGIQKKIPGWRWCLAPKCGAGQVHMPLTEIAPNAAKGRKAKKGKETAGEDVCVCDSCGAKACVSCDRPYHDGETCKQYQARAKRQNVDEEKATAKQIESTCKKCPNCTKNIEKDGGCDQVRCKSRGSFWEINYMMLTRSPGTACRKAFCWLCLTLYDVINKQGHAKSCMYARNDRFDPHADVNAPGNAAPGFFQQMVGAMRPW